MNRPNPPVPSRLNPVQSWLLGHIDTPTLRDLIDGSAELATAYGRALTDAAYAAELLADAQRVLEESEPGSESAPEDAYAMYQAAADHSDEALLLAQEAEGQPVGDERRERGSDFRDACRSLGLPPSQAEAEAER